MGATRGQKIKASQRANLQRRNSDIIKRFGVLKKEVVKVQGHQMRLSTEQVISMLAYEFYLSEASINKILFT